MESLLPIIVPSIITLIGLTIGYFLQRKGSKEANDTNAFKVVTDQLFALNENLSQKVAELEGKIKALLEDKDVKDTEISSLDRQLHALQEVNSALAGYVGKLIRHWPVGTGMPTLPTPDKPIDLSDSERFPRL